MVVIVVMIVMWTCHVDVVHTRILQANFLSELCRGCPPSSSGSPQFTRFPCLPILILFMTCAAKRGSQLSNGLSSAIRTPVLCSAEIQRVLHCRFTSLTAISTRPFDHTRYLDKSELETCLCLPVSESRSRKLRSESSFLFLLLLPTVQFDVGHQHPSTQAAHQLLLTACPESSCSCFSLLVGFFGFILALGVSASQGSSSSSILHEIPQPVRVISQWCYISMQSFRWTYERTALPSLFPNC